MLLLPYLLTLLATSFLLPWIYSVLKTLTQPQIEQPIVRYTIDPSENITVRYLSKSHVNVTEFELYVDDLVLKASTKISQLDGFQLLNIAVISLSTALLLIILFNKVFKPNSTRRPLKTQEWTRIVNTDTDTIPICIGKGDLEEEMVLNSYKKLIEETQDQGQANYLRTYIASPEDSSLGAGDYSGLESISDHNTESENSNSTSDFDSLGNHTNNTLDSFEKAERILDANLEFKNISSSVETEGTLSRIYSTPSHAKKLMYKRSTSVLTDRPMNQAEYTIDVTTANVYSEPFINDGDVSSISLEKNFHD